MEDNFIERLENEIAQQTRNGREAVYIDVEDLNKLGYRIDKQKTGRTYVDVGYLKIALNRYKFKDSLKVQPVKVETFKEVEEDIKKIENKNIHESWDSITK